MYHATRPTHCCASVWMHIEIINKYGSCPSDIKDIKFENHLAPSITLRLHPASIPDSRNKMFPIFYPF